MILNKYKIKKGEERSPWNWTDTVDLRWHRFFLGELDTSTMIKRADRVDRVPTSRLELELHEELNYEMEEVEEQIVLLKDKLAGLLLIKDYALSDSYDRNSAAWEAKECTDTHMKERPELIWDIINNMESVAHYHETH